MFTHHAIDQENIEKGVTHISPDPDGFLTLDIRTSRHTLKGDEPEYLGGKDTGPAPYDFLHAGLGSCTALTLKIYAKRKGIELNDFHVNVSSYRDEDKNLIIDKELIFHGNYTIDQVEKFAEISKKCPMHVDLARSIKINTIVKD